MDMTTLTDSEIVDFLEQNRADEMTACHFSAVSFTDRSLKAVLITESKFSRCSLANVDLTNSVLRSVEFEACNLVGINWTKLKKLADVTFKDCKLDYYCFQSLQLKNTLFINCSIKEADFSDSDISKTDFSGSMLAGTTFSRANLEKADLRRAKDYFIDPKITKIKGAKFSFPDAVVLIEALGAEVEF
jgi:fluoroquinolone resistance protein